VNRARSLIPAVHDVDLPSVHRLMGRLADFFGSRGYERIELPIMQPADVFLDVLGESAKLAAYVFHDPYGDMVCLRNDLTVPTCRAYLESHPDGNGEAKYCYSGLVFRALDEKGEKPPTPEFRQAGLEWFGDGNSERAEAEIVDIVLSALREAGLKRLKLKIGDVGLFRAIIESLDMPDRWRWKILDYFAKEKPLLALLKKLSAPRSRDPGPEMAALLEDLREKNFGDAKGAVADSLARQGVPLIGSRTLGEITRRLMDLEADGRERPLPREVAGQIADYLEIRAPLPAARERIARNAGHLGGGVAEALEAYGKRLQSLEEIGVDLEGSEFSAYYGRGFEYYSGFVFDIETEGDAPANRIAGGGRYDGLLKAAGARTDVPALGAAIYVERLHEALTRRAP